MAMTIINRRVDFYGLVRPHMGFRHGGDAVVLRELDGGLLAAVVDVLGHGPDAHAVAVRAAEFLNDVSDAEDPVALLRGLDQALRGTRGAGAGIGVLTTATGVLRYAGVGNTVIRRFGSGQERLIPAAGIIGGSMRTPREQQMTLQPGDAVVMYSDGVRDRFELGDYPQLPGQDAETIARTLIQRFGKDHDDAACIALRYDP
jgi:serine phosphatase RsbU (regulator of sigma subunit)